jgi:hypothetical protein
MTNSKGSGLFRGTVSEFYRRDWREGPKIKIRIVVAAEIRTRHLWRTNQNSICRIWGSHSGYCEECLSPESRCALPWHSLLLDTEFDTVHTNCTEQSWWTLSWPRYFQPFTEPKIDYSVHRYPSLDHILTISRIYTENYLRMGRPLEVNGESS